MLTALTLATVLSGWTPPTPTTPTTQDSSTTGDRTTDAPPVHLFEYHASHDAFALDCVHDGWVRVVRRMPTFHSLDALDRWLRRAVLTAALDRTRTDLRRARREASHSGDHHPAVDDETVELLACELESLGSDDRAIIDLRFRRGLTLARIADSLGIGMKATEMRLRRAVRRLRERVATATRKGGDS